MPLRMADHTHMHHHRNFCHWLTTMRASRVICIPLILIVTFTLIMHQYISSLSSEVGEAQNIHQRKLNVVEEVPNAKIADLKFRIEELKRIKASVTNELRELESKRQKLHSEISYLNTDIDKLNGNKQHIATELTQLKLSLDNAKIEHEEFAKQNLPQMLAPKRILPSLADTQHVPPPKVHQQCRLHTCFDFSRCALSSQFPVYFYNAGEHSLTNSDIDAFIKSSVTQALHASPHVTFDPHIACVYILLVGDSNVANVNSTQFEARLRALPYWNGDGRNHILLNMARTLASKDIFSNVNTHRAMIAQSAFIGSPYRSKFDVLIPPSLGMSHGQVWDQMPPISPARRKHLMSFQGQAALPSISSTSSLAGGATGGQDQELKVMPLPHGDSAQKTNKDDPNNKGRILLDKNQDSAHKAANRKLLNTHEDALVSEMKELLSLESLIVTTLKKMQQDYATDNFMFEFSCSEATRGVNTEWSICRPDSNRHEILQHSTFALIVAPTNYSILSTTLLQSRIYEAVKLGAVPVILGDHLKLPFEDFLDWNKAVLTLPKARVTELHMYVRSFSDSDILELRRQGRILWQSYFGSTKSIVDTLLAVVRTRLNIPAFPMREEPSPSIFRPGFSPLQVRPCFAFYIFFIK